MRHRPCRYFHTSQGEISSNVYEMQRLLIRKQPRKESAFKALGVRATSLYTVGDKSQTDKHDKTSDRKIGLGSLHLQISSIIY